MSNSRSDRVQGELLREWRESRQMDVSAVACLANLSVAQIQQLECGGSSLFYTASIKESAARKVAVLLGGDPLAVVRQEAPEDPLPESTVVDELIALSKKKATAAHPDALIYLRRRWTVAGGLVLLLLLLAWVALAWFQKSGKHSASPDGAPLAQAPSRAAATRSARLARTQKVQALQWPADRGP